MRQIYFVRHSIRDFTVREDKLVPLTKEGFQLANELTPFFIDKNSSAIYTSPYLRAVQTIEPTATRLNLKMTLDNNLRERSIGTWVDDFSGFSSQQWQNFDFKLEGGESLNEVKKRMLASYNNLLKKTASNIILSGHGTSLAVLFHSLLDGKFTLKEFNQMRMPDVYCANYVGDTLIDFSNGHTLC